MKKTSKIIAPILIVIAVVSLIVFTLNRNKKKSEAETAIVSQSNRCVNVQIDTVKYMTLNIDYKSNGIFIPFQELNLSAEQSGRVAKVYVNEGDVVHIGQALALIKTNQLSIDLENADAIYNNAKTNNKRYQNTFKTGGVTKQQVDEAALDLENAKAKLEQAKIKYNDATIKATINGIVNKSYIEPGTVVNPGTNLFELVNVSILKLQTTVNETRVANLQKGDTVIILASVLPGKEFKGIVRFIAPKANKSLNFPIEIEVKNTNNTLLRAGMYGSVSFGNSKNKILTVNRNAFVGSVSNHEVFVIKRDSTVVLRKVIPGLVTEKSVEIIQGLEQGDRVVISGQINLEDGSKVSPINK